MASPPIYEEIRDIARRAVVILREHVYLCCLFGSTACALYGVNRCPKDVDLIILRGEDTAYFKQLLADSDDPFYLAPSRRRNAGYKVLWYRLPSPAGSPRRKCKVDILVPGILNIPNIPPWLIKHKLGLPVMSLLPLLMMKLQGWTDHRDSRRSDFQAKQHVDVEDIEELLSIACRTGTCIGGHSLNWLPSDFI
ncbi:hypothetical protein FOMPIDRAFT_1136505 [Fomitopsis schrenkii]|uniref:Uncharacterized protein n=1 Tax=Fomitopsis schrenkii TaxID=2126942 RepID=S8DID5_FOMSC|nr:hypothetical protein FOMPIDRAFT_1136505 [Fomitopsis schrenkii]